MADIVPVAPPVCRVKPSWSLASDPISRPIASDVPPMAAVSARTLPPTTSRD
ncbi:hypothetical protein [Rosenbergiella epipactidis]|uniref:hypothetical protein n=1 Tax=Rosenbergiella epipactidis TaxID=1544694 RepID=UPI001F4D871E|nr:hypothetical protein [Rosenbergiella epipactidis]